MSLFRRLSTNSGHRYVVTGNRDWMGSQSDDRHTLTTQDDWNAFQKQAMEDACRNLEMVRAQ